MLRLKNKKAAMFGLDARIALAIFGALSVITGTALYEAVQQAKAVALLTEMQELSKAWEAYYLDTGSYLARRGMDPADYSYYLYNSRGLIEKPAMVSNWNGPYTSYNITPTTGYLYTSIPKYIHLLITNADETWGKGSEDTWKGNGRCVSGKKCYLTSQWTRIPSEDLAIIIDRKVDQGDGANKGRFRWYHYDTQQWHILLQTIPVKNPND